MTDPSTALDAIDRYSSLIFRLALLSVPDPDWASAAACRAFRTQDWTGAVVGAELETRLLVALPRAPRRRGSRSLLPVALRCVGSRERLALGLWLGQGYDLERIAVVLRLPAPKVRALLVDALAQSAGEDVSSIPAMCRASRIARLEQPESDLAHLRFCAGCRAAAAATARQRLVICDSINEFMAHTPLPPRLLELVAVSTLRAAPPSRVVVVLGPLLAVLVAALVVAALILPDRPAQHAATAAGPSISPRALLARAIARYDAPPGQKPVYRRYRIAFGGSGTLVDAEAWTDPRRPGRHQMQVRSGEQVWEWQAGDGEHTLSYWSSAPERLCGDNFAGAPTLSGAINRWSIGGAGQERMRVRRWASGPWAVARAYLEQASTAATLRSLGQAPGDRNAVVLAASGGTVDGLLLLAIRPEDGAVSEVRVNTGDNGVTRSSVVWRLVDEQSPDSAGDVEHFFVAAPAIAPAGTVMRSRAPLDDLCPLIADEAALSPARTLGWGWPAVVGLPRAPDGTQRVYLMGHAGALQTLGPTYTPDVATLVYLGGTRRLALTALRQLPSGTEDAVVVGGWRLRLHAIGPQLFAGDASPAPPFSVDRIGFSFWASGWTRSDLLLHLASARTLRLADLASHAALLHEPEPVPPVVIDYVLPALRRLPARAVGLHAVVERDMRAEPAQLRLDDPYHAEPAGGTTESWLRWDQTGVLTNFRGDTRGVDGRLRRVEWAADRVINRYDARANLVRVLPSGDWPDNPAELVERRMRDIFRYEQFHVVAEDARTLTLGASLPVTQTELAWGLRAQRRREPGAANWPWLADLAPDTIKFRTTFDRRSRQVIRWETYASNGAMDTLLERVVLRRIEWNATVDSSRLAFTPPAGTLSFEQASQHAVGSRQPVFTQDLTEAAERSAVPLWIWPESEGIQFSGAKVATPSGATELENPGALAAVSGGIAVELNYVVAPIGRVSLVEGSPALLAALLQQVPAPWTASLQETRSIGGSMRKVWSARNGANEHWIIFEVEQTLIVMHYYAPDDDSTAAALLERLARFRGAEARPPGTARLPGASPVGTHDP